MIPRRVASSHLLFLSSSVPVTLHTSAFHKGHHPPRVGRGQQCSAGRGPIGCRSFPLRRCLAPGLRPSTRPHDGLSVTAVVSTFNRRGGLRYWFLQASGRCMVMCSVLPLTPLHQTFDSSRRRSSSTKAPTKLGTSPQFLDCRVGSADLRWPVAGASRLVHGTNEYGVFTPLRRGTAIRYRSGGLKEVNASPSVDRRE
jgi:hypothetical protein